MKTVENLKKKTMIKIMMKITECYETCFIYKIIKYFIQAVGIESDICINQIYFFDFFWIYIYKLMLHFV